MYRPIGYEYRYVCTSANAPTCPDAFSRLTLHPLCIARPLHVTIKRQPLVLRCKRRPWSTSWLCSVPAFVPCLRPDTTDTRRNTTNKTFASSVTSMHPAFCIRQQQQQQDQQQVLNCCLWYYASLSRCLRYHYYCTSVVYSMSPGRQNGDATEVQVAWCCGLLVSNTYDTSSTYYE